MKKVMLVGGGKIGVAIAELLSGTVDYRLTVVDRDPRMLAQMPKQNVRPAVADVTDEAFVHEVEGHEIVLSATPFNLTANVAQACRKVGAHYLDLTEDVESTRTIKSL